MILCCGEALIDMLPLRAETGEICFRPHCGGAALNTAIALGRLGVETALVSGLSTDQFGRQLRQVMHESSVRSDLVVQTGRPTTLAFVDLIEGQASYSFWDQGSALREVQFQDLPAVPADVDLLLFGGISLCNLPVADSFVTWARQVSAQKTIMLDLNIRPGFAEDDGLYRARLEAMLRLADIVKLSEEDLDHFAPGDTTQEQKLQSVRDICGGLLLYTRGAAGAVALTAQGARVSVAAPIVETVDTVGAGDSFNAGFLAALVEEGQLNKADLQGVECQVLSAALAFATQVASLSVSRAGANPPWRHEIDR